MRIALLLAVLALPAGAQTAKLTIDPGMTREQVIATLGQPYTVKTSGSKTFYFYHNGCEKSCGMSDLVTLDSGRVIDAVFRAPNRAYSGKSSSPRMISPAEARKAKPATDTGLRVPVKKPDADD